MTTHEHSGHKLAASRIEELHRKYAPNEKVYQLVYGHCQVVNEIGQWCAANIGDSEQVDIDLLANAALLHDIGTYILFDAEGNVANEKLYPLHAILGAKIVADEGLDPRVAEIIETHVLLGLSKQEILARPWSLPARDYIPQTIEGELLCYADRFHSKKPIFNAYEAFLKRLMEDLPTQAERFEEWSNRFGVPNVEALARKYRQPVR